MAFTDNFNRADENLDASANWTTPSAGSCGVRSNKLAQLLANEAATRSPDQGNADQYVQCTQENIVTSWTGFLAIRCTDGNNFIGVRATSGYEVYKRVSGSFTLLGSHATTQVIGEVVYLEASGNSITFKVNGTTRVGPVTEAAHNTVTRAGIVSRAAVNPTLDNYENGALGAAPASLLRPHLMTPLLVM